MCPIAKPVVIFLSLNLGRDHLIYTISTYCKKYWMAAKAEIKFYAFLLKIWHPVTAFY